MSAPATRPTNGQKVVVVIVGHAHDPSGTYRRVDERGTALLNLHTTFSPCTAVLEELK